MRIIGGKYKGRKLQSPSSSHIRPTTDRMRETLFNILSHGAGNGFSGARILDIFAGTGALGLEALSRGAEHVTFVEKDRRSQEIIKKNIIELNAENITSLKSIDALKIKDFEGSFDCIFMDPPYYKCLITPLLQIIKSENLLRKDGVIIIESASSENLDIPEYYNILKEKSYGQAKVMILNKILKSA